MSVLVTGAPPQAYFAIQSNVNTPVGASLGGNDGVWLFKASDIINSDGTAKKLILLNAGAIQSIRSLPKHLFQIRAAGPLRVQLQINLRSPSPPLTST